MILKKKTEFVVQFLNGTNPGTWEDCTEGALQQHATLPAAKLELQWRNKSINGGKRRIIKRTVTEEEVKE